MNQKTINNHVFRIFFLQVLMIVSASILAYFAMFFDNIEIGFFWFAFIAGLFGGSIALQRKAYDGRIAPVDSSIQSFTATAMPILYGGIMAGVAYFLFVSGLLSGVKGSGLLASNFFPDFNDLGETEGIHVGAWLKLKPMAIDDAGKLIVWSFLAGYSESFVTGILDKLETSTSKAQHANEGQTDEGMTENIDDLPPAEEQTLKSNPNGKTEQEQMSDTRID